MSKIKQLSDVLQEQLSIIDTLINNIECGMQTITQGELHLLLKANEIDVYETLHGPLYKYNNIQLRIL